MTFYLILAAVLIFALGVSCGVSWALRELSGKRFPERRQSEDHALIGSSG